MMMQYIILLQYVVDVKPFFLFFVVFYMDFFRNEAVFPNFKIKKRKIRYNAGTKCTGFFVTLPSKQK